MFIKTDYHGVDEQLFIRLKWTFTAMNLKQGNALSAVLTLTVIMSAAPVFGQSSMGNMPNQSMGSMGGMTMSQMSYNVMAGGKNFALTVSSEGKLPTNPQFNEMLKSISFDVSGITSQDFVHYEIMIPVDLLSGNLTTTLGGVQVKSIAEVNGSLNVVHITVPSSFVKSNNIADSTTLVIAGTQAVPEFPIGATIVMVIVFAVLSLTMVRKKRFNFER